MAKVININNPDAGIHQYDDNRIDEMAKVVKQQYLNATDNVHRAVYAMEMFNIYIEQKMHEGLDCYNGGSRCNLKNSNYFGPWYYDPIRPNTVRLATQGGEGKDVPIEELEYFITFWDIRIDLLYYHRISLGFENGHDKLWLNEEHRLHLDSYYHPPIDRKDFYNWVNGFTDGLFDPKKISLFL